MLTLQQILKKTLNDIKDGNENGQRFLSTVGQSVRGNIQKDRALASILIAACRSCEGNIKTKARKQEISGNRSQTSAIDWETFAVELEDIARANDIWLEDFTFQDRDPSVMEKKLDAEFYADTNKSDVYRQGDKVIQVINMRGGYNLFGLIEDYAGFNNIFKDTPYEFVGFAKDKGQPLMIVRQKFIERDDNAHDLTDAEIYEYIKSIDEGFQPYDINYGGYSNGVIRIWDLHPGNIFRATDGKIYVIDANIDNLEEVDLDEFNPRGDALFDTDAEPAKPKTYAE